MELDHRCEIACLEVSEERPLFQLAIVDELCQRRYPWGHQCRVLKGVLSAVLQRVLRPAQGYYHYDNHITMRIATATLPKHQQCSWPALPAFRQPFEHSCACLLACLANHANVARGACRRWITCSQSDSGMSRQLRARAPRSYAEDKGAGEDFDVASPVASKTNNITRFTQKGVRNTDKACSPDLGNPKGFGRHGIGNCCCH